MQQSRLTITGGNELNGTVTSSGSKNAALPILAATICCNGHYKISNVPYLQDVKVMVRMLNALGVRAEYSKESVTIWNE